EVCLSLVEPPTGRSPAPAAKVRDPSRAENGLLRPAGRAPASLGVYTQHLSSLDFATYLAFAAVVVAALVRLLPGRAPPVRLEPYPDAELGVHDRKLPKYFLAGGGFLVLGGVHMVVKNLPWPAEWLARAGYAGHVVRDLSNTHV